MPKTTPGRALREARTRAGVSLDYAAAYTQFKLGKSMGISREQIRKMEANLVAPRDWNAGALLVLAELYDVDPDRLIPDAVDTTGLEYFVSLQAVISDLREHSSAWNMVCAGQVA